MCMLRVPQDADFGMALDILEMYEAYVLRYLTADERKHDLLTLIADYRKQIFDLICNGKFPPNKTFSTIVTCINTLDPT